MHRRAFRFHRIAVRKVGWAMRSTQRVEGGPSNGLKAMQGYYKFAIGL